MAYEFNDAENMVLGRVARWVGILAWIMIASSGLMVLGSFLTGDTVAIAGLMCCVPQFDEAVWEG